MVYTLVLLLTPLLAFPSGCAWGQRKHRPVYGTPGIRYGMVVKVLPRGYRVLNFKNVKYYYRHGLFYRPKGPRWVVVPPPIGAVVATLSATAILVNVLGRSYYLCEGTYYKKIPAGYKVVKAPPPPTNDLDSDKRVRVTAPLLNVRSGPGKQHRVLEQISKGNILTIKGNTRKWLYVELKDGTMGWVMKKYTKISPPPAQG